MVLEETTTGLERHTKYGINNDFVLRDEDVEDEQGLGMAGAMS
jgi:hypothetical protein